VSESREPRLHKATGVVVEVRKDRTIVELEIDPGEAGKQPQCSGCGLCSPAGAGAAKVELRAWLAEGVSVERGDRVEVEIRLATPSKAALLLYGLPLLAFLGASVGVWFATQNESASAVSGFSALGAAFLILFLVERGRGAGARVSRKI
jgi:positive regulator of sigma E activity